MTVQKDIQIDKHFNTKNDKCITPTSNCYRKDPNDVINSLKTRSQTKKQKIMMDYINEKKKNVKTYVSWLYKYCQYHKTFSRENSVFIFSQK